MSPTLFACVRRTALAVALLLPAAAARACEGDGVSVAVVAILATDQNTTIDRGLEGIAKEVQKDHPKLTGFRFAGSPIKKTIAVGGKDDFDLGNDQSLHVMVQEKSDKDDRYQLKITPPQMGDITYLTTCCGKYLPVMTAVKNKNNELLIVGVGVKPCTGK
jgi:hypothetical protein